MHDHDLYILRHGQTVWNAEGRLQGRGNSPLTALGLAQAARQRAILEAVNLAGVAAFSSPQARAVETAGIAVAPLMDFVATDPRLCEIDVGDWTGRLRSEIAPPREGASEFDAEDIALYASAPGGEGLAALRARCADFLQDRRGPCLVVAHGITGRMLRAVALGLEDGAMADMAGGQGVVHHLSGGVQRLLD